jgi:hypothetical protein
MTHLTNAFGIDIAQCNGAIDPVHIWDHADPLTFVGIRASISWGYPFNYPGRLEWFTKTWPIFEAIGRLPYHVLYPAEDGKAQVANFLKVVPAKTPHVRRVLDIELDHGQTRKVITDKAEYMVKALQDADGVEPVIYSRASWVDQFMEYRTWWDTVDWWLAQYYDRYHEDPRPLVLPQGVGRWLIYQTGDKCPSFGTPEAKESDYDRWNGDAEAVRNYFGFTNAPPPLALTIEQRLLRLEQMHGLAPMPTNVFLPDVRK